MNKEELIEIIKADRINTEQLRQLDRLIDDYPWFGLPRFLKLKAMHQAGKQVDPTEVSKAVVFSSDRGFLYRWIRGEAGSLQGVPVEDGSELEFITDDEVPGEEVSKSMDTAGRIEAGGDDEVGLMRDEEGTTDDGLDDGPGADDDNETDDDAHERAIPGKEETEMEEPEMEEPEAIPVIDPIDDEEDQEEDDSIAADSEEQLVTDEGRGSEDADVSEKEASGEETDGRVAGVKDEEVEEQVMRDQVSEDQGETERIPGDMAVEKAAASGDDEKAPGRRSTAERFQGGVRKSTSGAANHSTSLIEQFLNSEPGVIKADKQTSLEGDVSEGSVKEDDSFITDTLAKIYVKQGLHAKAIYAYERLSLKYPEKSAYFAAQIEKIKNISNI